MVDLAPPEALEALPDLTLSQCCERWGVSSRNSVKARAAALGVDLRRESSTRTVWPAEHLPLGDELAEHLKKPGGNLANFGRSLTPPAGGSEGVAPLAPAPSKGNPMASLTPPAGVTDDLMTLAQMAMALRPAADPLAVPRALQEAAEMGAWLSTRELADLLAMSPATVRGWGDGHAPRPGFRLARKTDRPVWWRVITDNTC